MSRLAARSLIATAPLLLVALGSAAPAAAADGEGLMGRPSDATITFFCFGVMVFFVAMVILGSVIQNRLDSRKERARADLERLRRP